MVTLKLKCRLGVSQAGSQRECQGRRRKRTIMRMFQADGTIMCTVGTVGI